jgi:hypothetical protein
MMDGNLRMAVLWRARPQIGIPSEVPTDGPKDHWQDGAPSDRRHHETTDEGDWESIQQKQTERVWG